MSLLIKNIRQLVNACQSPESPLRGKELSTLSVIEDGYLILDGDRISSYGRMKDLSNKESFTKTIDATNRCVFPSWCDAHTHVVYAGSREGEFADRIRGLTYEEIAMKGGGILNSAKKLRLTSEEELITSALVRLEEMVSFGTGAVEIKSGYGLDAASELKMLRVIKKLKTLTALTIKSTFLGAHAVPPEFANKREAYVDFIVQEMIPQIGEEKLADFCDVFCEKNYFTSSETIRILSAAAKFGMKGKVHAEQLSHTGGIQAGVESGAISVDHLEFANDQDISLLKGSSTIPVILPGAQWFLQLQNPPVRKMIDAGLPLAISTDYNPGSSPSGNMNFMLSIACVQYKMTPDEAILAASTNSAFAMDLGKTHGSISVGKMANIFITKPMPGFSFLPYSFANNLIETVILNGVEQKK